MWLGICIGLELVAFVLIDLVRGSDNAYRGPMCMAIACLALYAAVMFGFNARNDMEAYLYLNSIVEEETAMLNEAKKGPLNDTPEIQDLSGQLVAHIQQLNEYEPKAKKWAGDFVFKMVYPELVRKYWESPTFSYELKAEPVN